MTILPAEKDMSEWISELTYERKPLDKWRECLPISGWLDDDLFQ